MPLGDQALTPCPALNVDFSVCAIAQGKHLELSATKRFHCYVIDSAMTINIASLFDAGLDTHMSCQLQINQTH